MTSNIVDCGKFLQFGLSVFRPTVEVALLHLTSPELAWNCARGFLWFVSRGKGVAVTC